MQILYYIVFIHELSGPNFVSGCHNSFHLSAVLEVMRSISCNKKAMSSLTQLFFCYFSFPCCYLCLINTAIDLHSFLWNDAFTLSRKCCTFREYYFCYREEERLNNLRERYEAFLEEERKRRERNDRILQTLDRVESRAAMLTAKSERLRLLRVSNLSKHSLDFLQRGGLGLLLNIARAFYAS